MRGGKGTEKKGGGHKARDGTTARVIKRTGWLQEPPGPPKTPKKLRKCLVRRDEIY